MAVWRRSTTLLDWLYDGVARLPFETVISSSSITISIECVHRLGFLEGLKWFASKGFLIEKPMSAARGGHLHILLWLLQNNPKVNMSSVVYAAASEGHLNIVEWAFQQSGVPIDNITYVSVNSGNLDLVKFLVERGYLDPKDSHYDLCGFAADHAHFEILDYLREKEFAWGRTAEGCSRIGSKERLKMYIDQGCPYDQHICSSAKNRDMHNWIFDNGYCRCQGIYMTGLERFSSFVVTRPEGTSQWTLRTEGPK